MLLFMDGADYRTTVGKWIAAYVGGNAYTLATPSGAFHRTGTQSIYNGNDQRNGMYVSLPQRATVWAVFAYLFSSVPYTWSTAPEELVCHFNDGVNEQIEVRIARATRVLQVTRNGTLLGTGSSILNINTFYHIDLSVVISDTVGSFVLKLNGLTEISGSGIDTKATANAYVDRFYLGGGYSEEGAVAPGERYWDDVAVGDDQGSFNTSSPGDVAVEAIHPTGAGATTAWTPSAGTNWQNVDDALPDDDATYNKSNTVGQTDMYAMADLAEATGLIKAVQYVQYARKDNAGTRLIAPVVRIGGADYAGSDIELGATYDHFTQLKEVSPATSAAWTISEINAMEYGIKVTG